MRNIKKLSFLLLFLAFSCSNLEKKIVFEDTFDLSKVNKKSYSQQLKIRVDRINELKDFIHKIDNHNRKYKAKLDFENFDSSKTEALYKVINDNNIMINKYNFEIKKLKKDIDILNSVFFEDNNVN